MSDFYKTRIGSTFYSHTMPGIAKSLKIIAEKGEVDKKALAVVCDLAGRYIQDNYSDDPDAVGTWIVSLDKVRAYL
jgi:hypothetical protein